MTFDQLLSFLTATETGSFTEAGIRLSQSQSSISQQIKALENELGIPLFERAYRSIVLTTGGKTLLPYALRIRQELEAVRSAMAELNEQVSGPLRIGASTTNGNYLLPSILLELKTAYPLLSITMVIENNAKLLDGLQQGKADLLLLEGERPQTLGSRFEVEPFYDDQLVVVKNSQFKLKKKINLNDVVKLPWIMREIGSGTRELLLKRLQEHQFSYDDMTVLMEVGTIEAIKQGLLKTNAVSYLSRLAIDQELKNGQLDIVELEDLNVNRQLWLVSPLKPYRTMPMRAFRKALSHAVLNQ